MNHNKKVVALILIVTTIYLSLSVFSKQFISYYPNFKNVNLIADIVHEDIKEKKKVNKGVKKEEIKKLLTSPKNTFDSYIKKGTLIKFDADTIEPALAIFNQKLKELGAKKNRKIRIAWFGDSQIEGDFITQDIREMLQNYFGQQKGVGFVPINSISADFRTTSKLKTTGEVETYNFKNKGNNKSLFLSGFSFYSNDLLIDFQDKIKKNSGQITEKWLLFGKGDSIKVTIGDSIRIYPANNQFNRVLIDRSSSNTTKFHVSAGNTPLYGLSSEPTSGVILDNFSFRGTSGVELKNIDDELLEKISSSGYYDLIVFQYGVNLLYKPDNIDFNYYYRGMNKVLKKFKAKMPNTDFLIFSCSDRAFNYDGEWKTAIGIDSLINIQAKLAFQNKIPFYNFYQSIGGEGTIVKWADSTTAYANKDYIHFNYKGAKTVSKIIYKAIINDYNKAQKRNMPIKKAIPIKISEPKQEITKKEDIKNDSI